MAFQNYAANLARQQNSTYTLPFEVVTPNMGMISLQMFTIEKRLISFVFPKQFSEWMC